MSDAPRLSESESSFVVDASAVIAVLVGERLTRFDPEQITGASISAVNLAETLTRLREIGLSEDETVAAVTGLDLRVLAFDDVQARRTAKLRAATRHAGLSLGDRACLALGQHLGIPVVTADRAWAKVDAGIEVVLIR